jgi:hypothetical protein
VTFKVLTLQSHAIQLPVCPFTLTSFPSLSK